MLAAANGDPDDIVAKTVTRPLDLHLVPQPPSRRRHTTSPFTSVSTQNFINGWCVYAQLILKCALMQLSFKLHSHFFGRVSSEPRR